jgi:hypothetical protein
MVAGSHFCVLHEVHSAPEGLVAQAGQLKAAHITPLEKHAEHPSESPVSCWMHFFIADSERPALYTQA